MNWVFKFDSEFMFCWYEFHQIKELISALKYLFELGF